MIDTSLINLPKNQYFKVEFMDTNFRALFFRDSFMTKLSSKVEMQNTEITETFFFKSDAITLQDDFTSLVVKNLTVYTNEFQIGSLVKNFLTYLSAF